jgi:transmembrane sensor
MEERGAAQVISEEATRWVARADSRPLDGKARLELGQWLARDERHRGALFRALAVWQALGADDMGHHDIWDMLDAPSHDGGGDTEVVQEVAAPTELRPPDTKMARRRFLWTGGAIAAALVPVAFVPRLWNPRGAGSLKQISTGRGERTTVPLPDGSLVVANTASALEVDQSAHMRNVRLDRGEAWFEVAKDTSRPFVVAAGDVRVRAVGTAFSVRRRDGGADVQVTEGTVEVWTQGQSSKRAAISAGSRTFVSEMVGAQASVEDPAGIERTLAWREGALKFQGDTLREAVAEFNRYNATQLEIDPALADEKIVGRFNTKEPDAFANVVSLEFGARIERDDKIIRIAKN